MDEEWVKKWNELSEDEQQLLAERLGVHTYLFMRSPWVKLWYLPDVLWQHYLITRRYDGILSSMWWSVKWTCILVYPVLFCRESK